MTTVGEGGELEAGCANGGGGGDELMGLSPLVFLVASKGPPISSSLASSDGKHQIPPHTRTHMHATTANTKPNTTKPQHNITMESKKPPKLKTTLDVNLVVVVMVVVVVVVVQWWWWWWFSGGSVVVEWWFSGGSVVVQ